MKAHMIPTPDEIAARQLTPESIERGAALFREYGFLAIDGVHDVEYLDTVHDAYLEFVATGQAPDPLPEDPAWCRPQVRRTPWYDLFDPEQRLEAFETLWNAAQYQTKSSSSSHAAY